MITPEDQAILDALDFDYAPKDLTAKQRLVRAAGALASLSVTALALRYVPDQDVWGIQNAIELAPTVLASFLGYEAITGDRFFGSEPQDSELES